ncbi:MAG: hypothetical protein QM311_01850, partial [Acidobacteriota bacterium]|nr:hypothetical protein [Acidobacteriota bacterium]
MLTKVPPRRGQKARSANASRSAPPAVAASGQRMALVRKKPSGPGASRDAVVAAAREFIEPGSTAVFGVFHEGALWASLILTLDDDASVTSITTADPAAEGHARALEPGDLRTKALLRGELQPVELVLLVALEAVLLSAISWIQYFSVPAAARPD